MDRYVNGRTREGMNRWVDGEIDYWLDRLMGVWIYRLVREKAEEKMINWLHGTTGSCTVIRLVYPRGTRVWIEYCAAVHDGTSLQLRYYE